MAKTIANPEEIEIFASVLQAASDAIWTEAQGLKAHFEDLGSHWRDGNFTRFEQVFHEMIRHLNTFHRSSDTYVRHLRVRASILREYLQRRY